MKKSSTFNVLRCRVRRAYVRRARWAAGILAFLLVVSEPRAQETFLPDRVRAAADGITAEQLKRDLEFLASDGLLGRNTPSPGFDAAADYIAKRLKQAGLIPLGDEGTYFQRYTMKESRVDVGASYLEVSGARLRLGGDFVMQSFAGPVSATLPLVYVGHGWTVPGRGIDPFAGLDVRGKIVVAHGPGALPKGVDIQIRRVTVGAISPQKEASRRGAAAVIFVPLTSRLKDWEQMRSRGLARREMEPPVPSAYAAPRITSILLSAAATTALFDGERVAGAELIARGDSADYPPSFQLTRTATLSIVAGSELVHRPYNVVAMVEGSDPLLKRECVTVESHLDGAVGTRAVDGDPIYNAADDNASGSAATLAIAERMMTTARPGRSIVFIWDSGEEQGLWGTRYFVSRPPVPLGKIVAHFNIDMIGATRTPGSADAASPDVAGPNEVYLVGPAVLSASADRLLQRVNAAYLNMTFNRAYDRADNQFFYPRTDAGPFLERGVLTIDFFTGLHPRYHLPSDEARYLDPRKMQAIARTVFASVWMFADAADAPRIDKAIPATVPRYK